MAAAPPPEVPFMPPMVPGPLAYPPQPKADGMAVASLVLGCVSLVGLLCAGGFILPVPIVGVILGVVSKTRVGLRTAGIITNSIAIALAVIFGVILIIAVAARKP